MQDQQKLWDDSHAKRQLQSYSVTETIFAQEVNKIIPKHSLLLELGCGEGNDSLYFAKQGHTVLATDFSAVGIDNNRKNIVAPGLEFKVQDISKPFEYGDNNFDVIYARLSLHYFTDQDTQKIFAELARVLKPNGQLCFMCKSVDDDIYDEGTEIEKDMFELNGHVRHFFSEAYTRQLLADAGFTIRSLEHGRDNLYDRESAFITVIAQV